jgi:hypothetical protein
MFGRFRRAVEAGRAAIGATPPPSDAGASPSLPPMLALLALDEIGPGAAGLRDRHLSAARAQGARALFILSPDSAPDLADNTLLCEFLPLPEDLARTTGDPPEIVGAYRHNRLRLILDKWSVSECRWIGESAAELVDGWTPEADLRLRPIRFRPAP